MTSTPNRRRSDEKVKGVLITSNGDQLHGKDKYVAIEICKSHPIFEFPPTGVSEAMGLAILVQLTLPFAELMEDPVRHLNRTAAYLHLPLNPELDKFGLIDVFMDDMYIGPVQVVRRDKKPITPRQVEALAVFCRFHIAEEHRLLTRIAFGPEEAEERLLARREFVQKKVSREEFERFFEVFKKRRAEENPSWDYVVSPYEV
jgi:hypothetical protein